MVDLCRSLLDQAARARAAGQGAAERNLLDRAVALHSSDPQAQNARGMRALADQDAALAVASFTKASAADPAEPALLINLATAHRMANDDAGEEHSLQAALNIDQRLFIAQLRMAELLQRRGLISRAAPHWAAVVQLADGMPDKSSAMTEAGARARAVLAEHNAVFATSLDKEFGGQLPDRADAPRFRACVDGMFGRRKIYRNECAGIHYPFLPADEFFDRRLFPWFGAVEAHTAAIRAEARALLAHGNAAVRPYVRLDQGTPNNKWSLLDNSADWSAAFLWEYGKENEAMCAACPATAEALKLAPQSGIPGKAPSAFFSVLRPGAHIPPHTGVTNTRAIVHLPLIVPPRCGFRVGGETREWREGEAFAFDDTIEHEAWNHSTELRVVLIFDVWNPHLRVDEQADLTKLFAVAERELVSTKAS